jgi:hypothetical protein
MLLRFKQTRVPGYSSASVAKALADLSALFNHRPVQILLIPTLVASRQWLNSNRKSVYRAYKLNARIYILQVDRFSKKISLIRFT